MNILLTGSDGFTGRHFAKLAASKGHTIFPLKADLGDVVALDREVLEIAPEAVVHLAAISFVGHPDSTAFYAVNVIGTMNLLAALIKLPQTPHRVLLASSANVYGNCEQSPIGETQAPAPVNHYAVSKLAMEHMSQIYGDRLPLVITRPFNYTGPGQAENFVIPKLLHHFVRRASAIELGNLHVEREFNDIRTVCVDYLTLLNCAQPSQTYNICTGQPHTLQNVIEMLTRMTGHQIGVVVNPAFVRSNEVRRLCGSPVKLEQLFRQHGVVRDNRSLEETLREMLTNAHEHPAQNPLTSP